MQLCLSSGKVILHNMLCPPQTAILTIATMILILSHEFLTTDAGPQRQRYVTLNGCNCDALQCECCASINFANSTRHEVCTTIQVIPNEITLRGTIRFDGNDVYVGQLDPSVAPICFPAFPTVCFSINHVDVSKRQVCTKLTLFFFTLVKFPCVGQENGQLVVQMNTYV